jgi:hypothetical protein
MIATIYRVFARYKKWVIAAAATLAAVIWVLASGGSSQPATPEAKAVGMSSGAYWTFLVLSIAAIALPGINNRVPAVVAWVGGFALAGLLLFGERAPEVGSHIQDRAVSAVLPDAPSPAGQPGKSAPQGPSPRPLDLNRQMISTRLSSDTPGLKYEVVITMTKPGEYQVNGDLLDVKVIREPRVCFLVLKSQRIEWKVGPNDAVRISHANDAAGPWFLLSEKEPGRAPLVCILGLDLVHPGDVVKFSVEIIKRTPRALV